MAKIDKTAITKTNSIRENPSSSDLGKNFFKLKKPFKSYNLNPLFYLYILGIIQGLNPSTIGLSKGISFRTTKRKTFH